MKYLCLFLLMVLSVGCSSSTQYGKCVGLNGHEDPNLVYEYDGWNIGMGILFSEFIIPPIVVALDELKCPVGKK